MTDNDNLELKKRSRRRLVGAAALALLAAIVLPMVLDQEPGVPTQDIHVYIPDRDAENMAARPIAGRAAMSAEPQLAPPPVEEAPAEAASIPEAANESSNAAASIPAGSSAVAAQAPRAAGTPPAAPTARPAGTPTVSAQADSKTAPASPAPKDESARVRALLDGQPSAAIPASDSYVVQVGAFGEAAKAASLSSDLKGRGFTAYTEKAGSVTRVRVGPFPSKEQAEKVAERLRANGLNGVVAPR